MHMEAYFKLLQLEGLFPRLEALYLNFALDDVVKAYYGRLLEGVAERRSSRRGRGQPQPWPRPQLKLKVLNINIVEGYLHGDWLGELTAKVLRPLLPQLEHFGPVFARYDLKKVLRFSAKLTSLKVDFLERGFEGIPQYRVKHSAKRVAHRLAGITSLVLATPTLPPLPDQWGEFEDEDEDEDDEVGELLKHCTGVRRMKMVRKRFRMVYEQYQIFDSDHLRRLAPMAATLQELTLVNYDLDPMGDGPEGTVFPEVTSLTVVGDLPILEGFRRHHWQGRLRYDCASIAHLVDVPALVELLGGQFPRLQRLTLIGQVYRHWEVLKQLRRALASTEVTEVQLHFADNDIRKSLYEGPARL